MTNLTGIGFRLYMQSMRDFKMHREEIIKKLEALAVIAWEDELESLGFDPEIYR